MRSIPARRSQVIAAGLLALLAGTATAGLPEVGPDALGDRTPPEAWWQTPDNSIRRGSAGRVGQGDKVWSTGYDESDIRFAHVVYCRADLPAECTREVAATAGYTANGRLDCDGNGNGNGKGKQDRTYCDVYAPVPKVPGQYVARTYVTDWNYNVGYSETIDITVI